MSNEDTMELPESWKLSPQQDCLIGSLYDEDGGFLSPAALSTALYGGKWKIRTPAPAKLRVLVQRCRGILEERTKGRVEIKSTRNKGYRISKKDRAVLRKFVEKP